MRGLVIIAELARLKRERDKLSSVSRKAASASTTTLGSLTTSAPTPPKKDLPTLVRNVRQKLTSIPGKLPTGKPND